MTTRSITEIIRDPVVCLADYVQRIVDLGNAQNCSYSGIWYRGVSNAEYDLVPGIVWKGLLEDEESLVDEFLINLPAYSAQTYADPWDLYCLMQHHGLPTRLLDWTKSPLAALFFALDNAKPEADFRDTPVVWLLDPFALNRNCHNDDSIFVPNTHYGRREERDLINSYLPNPLRPHHTHDPIPLCPIAVEPPFTNPRVLAQQGCFTIHGTEPTPLNKFDYSRDILAALRIDPANIECITWELNRFGFRPEWIYQDLDRLAKRITKDWQNE